MGPNPTQGLEIYARKPSNFTQPSKKKVLLHLSKVEVAAAPDWKQFKIFLRNAVTDERQIDHRVKFAKEYLNVLQTGDASDLLKLTRHNQLYAMKTLAKLSKFLGCYSEWQHIKQDYGLSWKQEDDLAAFTRLTEGEDIDDMLEWVRKASRIAPGYKDVLRYACLTGLRPEEVFMTLRLPNEGYYDPAKGILEHFKFGQFIRRTKKAYLSVMTKETLRIRDNFNPALSYNILRLALRRHDFPMNMAYCRKIHGTFLRQKGIDAELVDLLQGRLPKSVFMRHYYRPNLADEVKKVKACLGKLSNEILYQ